MFKYVSSILYNNEKLNSFKSELAKYFKMVSDKGHDKNNVKPSFHN